MALAPPITLMLTRSVAVPYPGVSTTFPVFVARGFVDVIEMSPPVERYAHHVLECRGRANDGIGSAACHARGPARS